MGLRPGYKQTEIGVIPEDWDAVPLGQIGETLIGLTYRPEEVRSDGTLVLRSSNIQNDALSFEDNVFVNAEIPDRIMVLPSDVLICVRNGSRDLIGKSVLLDARTNGMTFGAFMAVHRSSIGDLVAYHFQSEIVKRQINEHLGATINQITNKSLNSFKIPVPPRDTEQRAIAAVLSDVDAALAGLGRLVAKKRDLKQGAMQQLLTGETRLPGFTGDWQLKRLGDVAYLHKGQIVPALHPNDVFEHYSLPSFDEGKIPVLEKGACIGSNKFLVPVGAILVSKLNPRIPRVWTTENIQPRAVASTEFLVLTNKINVDREYLAAVCGSLYFCNNLENAVTGSTGSHQRVAPAEAMKLSFKWPLDLDEQSAIANTLFHMESEIETLEARREKMRMLKQAMMQALLTGRVRLPIPHDAATDAPPAAAHG